MNWLFVTVLVVVRADGNSVVALLEVEDDDGNITVFGDTVSVIPRAVDCSFCTTVVSGDISIDDSCVLVELELEGDCGSTTVVGDSHLVISRAVNCSFVTIIYSGDLSVVLKTEGSLFVVEGDNVVTASTVVNLLIDGIMIVSETVVVSVTLKLVACSMLVVLLMLSIVGCCGTTVILTVVCSSLVVAITVVSTAAGGGITVTLKVLNVCLVVDISVDVTRVDMTWSTSWVISWTGVVQVSPVNPNRHKQSPDVILQTVPLVHSHLMLQNTPNLSSSVQLPLVLPISQLQDPLQIL